MSEGAERHTHWFASSEAANLADEGELAAILRHATALVTEHRPEIRRRTGFVARKRGPV